MSKTEKPQEDVNHRVATKKRRSLVLPTFLGSLLLLSGLAAYLAVNHKRPESAPEGEWSATVKRLSRAGGGEIGLEVCANNDSTCLVAVQKSVVQSPSRMRTDERTRANLGFNDTDVTLDRSTEMQVPDGKHRRMKMIRGSAVVDARRDPQAELELDVPGARLLVGPAKVAVTADAKGSVVDVAHGVLKIVDDKQHELKLHAGEQVRIVDGSLRPATINASQGEELLWSENEPETETTNETSRGLGELKAKKPGASDEIKGVVSLASHQVEVRIAANLVRTQIDETFVNRSNDVLEGIYRFPLPSDAKIEKLALDVDGKLEEGAFVDRDRAAAIWRGAIVNATPLAQRVVKDDIVWVPGPWRDPALLEWQRGGRFELRIYPIPKQGSRRVVITYTQVSNPSGDARRYTYPLAYDPSGSTKIGKFDLDVQVRGHDAEYGVRSLGYALRQATDGGVTRLSLSENDFTPHGDIVLEYALPHREAELKAWAYGAGNGQREAPTTSVPSSPRNSRDNDGYAALALRPNWPRNESNLARDLVVVVDASRSMLGENLKRATKLAKKLVAELEPSDRAGVIACDSVCQILPEGMVAAGPELAQSVERFLTSIRAEGASDPTAAIHAAMVFAGRGNSEHPLSIVYIGDATPTVGPVRPGTIEKAVEHDLADASASVIAVGVGGESDAETLSALARGGGGVAVNYLPGKGVDEVAYNVISAVRGTHLRDVHVSLPDGLVDIAPRRPNSLRSGSELWVVARMQRASVRGDVVLTGRLGNQPFERRWPVELVATESDGNAFVPRLFAAARIADLERLGDAESKKDIIDLSQRHHVASRYTSLLVLESEAMFKAFNLKKSEQTTEWTGEADDEQQVAMAENKAEESAPRTLSATSRLSVGQGRFSGGAGKAKESADELSPAASPAPAADKAPASLIDAMRETRRGGPSSPAYAQPPPAPAPLVMKKSDTEEVLVPDPPAWRPRVRMVPMRRVWERRGSFTNERVPADASLRALTKAEDEFDRDPERRNLLKSLLALYARRGELDHADSLVQKWVDKEPLDADALTARADAAARRGLRNDAIRLLGSVIDSRPDDVKAQQRLARLYRWAGEREQSCRYWIALTEFHSENANWLAEAVRCSRDTDGTWLAEELLGNASEPIRQRAEKLLAQSAEPTDTLSGDLRIEAEWSSDADVDIALVTPDGQRVSWLGAPTRQVITARNVTSHTGEALCYRNAPVGSYVIELVRVAGAGLVRGNLMLTIADHKQTVPFVLREDRTVAGVATIRVTPKLLPL